MKALKKNRLNSIFAIVLLCAMGLKMCVILASHFTAGNDSYAIEKSIEEGKDAKEETFKKGQKKLMFEGRDLAAYIRYQCLNLAKPVCRYRMQQITNPPKTVATPPPNFV